VAGHDSTHDLVRLRVPGLTAPPLPLRLSTELRIGERVYAVGAPQGLELSLSEGLISGLRLFEGVRVIQTTAAISAGSSGGGLFDDRGRLRESPRTMPTTGNQL
jgi:S1-C subfamily serine protease